VRLVGRLDEIAAQKQLELARLVLDMGKGQRALFAPGHQPPRHRRRLPFQLGEVIQDGFGVMRPLAARRIRIQADGAERSRLGHASVANFDQWISCHNLGRGGKKTDVDDVLDFFDSPLGNLTDRGYLDEKLVYDFFFEWIRGYWSACKEYIECQPDRTKWNSFSVLYEAAIEIHKREPGSDKKTLLTGDDLREFLEWELE
jgi:hypothetical protein